MDKAENNCKCYIFTIEKTEMQKKSNAKKNKLHLSTDLCYY